MLSEFQRAAKGIMRWALAVVAVSAFFFTFGLREASLAGIRLLVPSPSADSFAAVFYRRMQEDLVPPSVHFVVTTPLEAFVVQVKIALVLGFTALLPLILIRAARYFAPALLPRERRALLSALLPSALLFFGGAAFAYVFVIPPAFTALYALVPSLGAEPLISVGAFVGFVLALMLAAGAMFLAPAAMALLSASGAVPPRFWVEKWRHAVLTLVVSSAIITPDGSGITLALLAAPLVFLYVAGAVVGAQLGRRRLLATG